MKNGMKKFKVGDIVTVENIYNGAIIDKYKPHSENIFYYVVQYEKDIFTTVLGTFLEQQLKKNIPL